MDVCVCRQKYEYNRPYNLDYSPSWNKACSHTVLWNFIWNSKRPSSAIECRMYNVLLQNSCRPAEPTHSKFEIRYTKTSGTHHQPPRTIWFFPQICTLKPTLLDIPRRTMNLYGDELVRRSNKAREKNYVCRYREECRVICFFFTQLKSH